MKYTPNYCEENIWHLCQARDLVDQHKRVLFISSLSRNTPLMFQKSGVDELPVWWDYHVILMVSKAEQHLIYDFDSSLPFPTEARHYLTNTFQKVSEMKIEEHPLFKIIEGQDYVQQFHSDRSHMKSEIGKWIFEPPTWPVVSSNGTLGLSTLMDFSNASQQRSYRLEQLLQLVQVPK